MAPIIAVTREPIKPVLASPIRPKTKPPTAAPIIPTTMFPRMPKPLPRVKWPAAHPAMMPIISQLKSSQNMIEGK